MQVHGVKTSSHKGLLRNESSWTTICLVTTNKLRVDSIGKNANKLCVTLPCTDEYFWAPVGICCTGNSFYMLVYITNRKSLYCTLRMYAGRIDNECIRSQPTGIHWEEIDLPAGGNITVCDRMGAFTRCRFHRKKTVRLLVLQKEKPCYVEYSGGQWTQPVKLSKFEARLLTIHRLPRLRTFSGHFPQAGKSLSTSDHQYSFYHAPENYYYGGSLKFRNHVIGKVCLLRGPPNDEYNTYFIEEEESDDDEYQISPVDIEVSPDYVVLKRAGDNVLSFPKRQRTQQPVRYPRVILTGPGNNENILVESC